MEDRHRRHCLLLLGRQCRLGDLCGLASTATVWTSISNGIVKATKLKLIKRQRSRPNGKPFILSKYCAVVRVLKMWQPITVIFSGERASLDLRLIPSDTSKKNIFTVYKSKKKYRPSSAPVYLRDTLEIPRSSSLFIVVCCLFQTNVESVAAAGHCRIVTG